MTHQILRRKGAPDLAYVAVAARDTDRPAVIFMGGYRSDMNGTKALYLEAQCRARGQGYVRFDYRGHGLSGGDFKDGTIGLWLADARAVVAHAVPAGPVVLVGSSMGGWMALLAGRDMGPRLQGIVGIAAAPDFTRDIYQRLDADMRGELAARGCIAVANDYSDEPYVFTQEFFTDGEAHCLLDRAPEYPCALRLVQGMKDNDVPWQTAFRIKKAVQAQGGVEVVLVAQGDHRLSRPADLALIDRQVRVLSGYGDGV